LTRFTVIFASSAYIVDSLGDSTVMNLQSRCTKPADFGFNRVPWMNRFFHLITTLLLCAYLAACGTDTSSGASGSGSSGSGSGTGSGLTLRLTDAPFDDAVRVTVKFVEVRLRTKGGNDWVSIDLRRKPQPIDLLALQGTKTADLLRNVKVPRDDYDELRLIVDTTPMANTIELSGGGIVELKIPSGGSSGLKIKGDFTVSENLPTSLVVDVDLRQSIKKNGPNYIMNPVLRLVKGDNFGHSRGIVDPALLTAASCSDPLVDTFNAVYVYSGHNVTPDDINQKSTQDIDPLTTTRIAYDTATSSYLYEAAFLPAGDYTIAFTCNSNLDDLDKNDNLKFFNIQNLTVKLNNTRFF